MQVVVVSPDKDLFQLVSDKVLLCDPFLNKTFGIEELS
jgi:5'-3' exonuclease